MASADDESSQPNQSCDETDQLEPEVPNAVIYPVTQQNSS